jgi:hypothetical protein
VLNGNKERSKEINKVKKKKALMNKERIINMQRLGHTGVN